jgi:hypothetical protein
MSILSRLFKRKKLTSYILSEKYKVVLAFEFNGKKYFMFDNQFDVPTGRGLVALTFYEEFNMRCTSEYLTLHTRAMEKLLSDPKKINIQAIALINQNLKERLNLAVFPDHIYKLASVIFFDETESPYSYDFKYNNEKIEKWKASGGTLDFFMKTQLKDLIPSLQLPDRNAESFFQVAGEVDRLHRKDLQEILSSNR